MTKSKFLNNRSESISTKMTLKSHKLLTGVLALVFVVGMASPAFALTIDSFDTGTMSLSANNVTTMDTQTDLGLPASETIGEARITKIIWESGTGGNVMASANPPVGIMSYSSDFGLKGNFTTTYDSNGAGLGCIDITQGNSSDRIQVEYNDADLTSGTVVTITDCSDNTSSLVINTGMSGPRTLDFLFSNFVGSADFTDVKKIEVLIIGVTSGDYAIEIIGIPQMRVGGIVGSMDTTALLVAGAQANMGLWSLALVGAVATSAAIIYKTKSNKSEQ